MEMDMKMERKFSADGRWRPGALRRDDKAMEFPGWSETVSGMAWELARPPSNQKFMVADEEYAERWTRNIDRRTKKIALKIWRQITPTYLKRLYESMPQRLQAVVNGEGGHTNY